MQGSIHPYHFPAYSHLRVFSYLKYMRNISFYFLNENGSQKYYTHLTTVFNPACTAVGRKKEKQF
jgi:hypothetical protein